MLFVEMRRIFRRNAEPMRAETCAADGQTGRGAASISGGLLLVVQHIIKDFGLGNAEVVVAVNDVLLNIVVAT